MYAFNQLIRASVLLFLAGAIACGPGRGSRVRGAPGGGGDPGVQGQGQKASGKFDQAVRNVVNSNGSASKPKPETSFMSVAKDLKEAYSSALQGDQKQTTANQNLDKIFAIFKMSQPHLTEDKNGISLKITTFESRQEGASEKFVFEGVVTLKAGKGELKATKIPQDLANNATVNAADSTVEDQTVDSKISPARKINKKPQTSSPSASAPRERFVAHVSCLDSECLQMIVKFIDRTKGFYPVAVKALSLAGQNQPVVANLVAVLADRAKDAATKMGLKINENPGSGQKWAIDLNDATFDLHTQTTVDLVTGRMSSQLQLGNLVVNELDIDLSRTHLEEQLIGINPKK